MKEYIVKSGFIGRPRKLILSPDYIEWENKDVPANPVTRLDKADIVDFRHGMDWVVWYRFTVGRRFSITFLDKTNKELKIRFDSHFGLHMGNDQLYADMVDVIWDYYQSDIVNDYLKRYYSGEELALQGITLSLSGVRLKGHNSILRWENVGIKEYYSYFAIYDRENPLTHSRVSYDEYGTETLWGVMKNILNRPG